MKKFKFKMEALYKLRKEEERQVMMDMAQLRQKEVRLLNKLKTIRIKRGDWIQTYNEVGSSYNQGEQVLLIEQYLVALETQQDQVKSEIKTLSVEIAAELKRLEKAYLARKQVETLKEKQKEVWFQDMKQKENHFMDEMNNIRFIREKLATQ